MKELVIFIGAAVCILLVAGMILLVIGAGLPGETGWEEDRDDE